VSVVVADVVGAGGVTGVDVTVSCGGAGGVTFGAVAADAAACVLAARAKTEAVNGTFVPMVLMLCSATNGALLRSVHVNALFYNYILNIRCRKHGIFDKEAALVC
jgi:hypothetical protein